MELIWQEDIYPKNRGWVVDQLTAIIDGEDRQEIVLAMNLPKNISQKALCNKIEEIAMFIRVAKV